MWFLGTLLYSEPLQTGYGKDNIHVLMTEGSSRVNKYPTDQGFRGDVKVLVRHMDMTLLVHWSSPCCVLPAEWSNPRR